MNVAVLDLFYADQEWAKLRRPSAIEFAQRRLDALARALGDKPYLDGAHFTAGDLMMTTVLRIIPALIRDQRLAAYVERCTSRPAFKRALDAQMGDFRKAGNSAAVASRKALPTAQRKPDARHRPGQFGWSREQA
jgi:glutathione S-transferase